MRGGGLRTAQEREGYRLRPRAFPFLTFADDRPSVPHQSSSLRGSKKARQAVCERLARLHARIRDRRSDFLQKLSTGLIENQAVFAETLSIKGMMKSRLARSIGDAAWGELLRQPKYNATLYGRTFWLAPRTLTSSKTCSDCGFKLKVLPLSTRSGRSCAFRRMAFDYKKIRKF